MTQEQEAQLDQILAEFLERRESGDAVDAADLIAAHPEFAAQIREYFADEAQLRDVAQPIAVSHVSRRPVLGTLRYFGDYELLEEVARGGMGIVYRARQTSLNRIVAVKLILSGHLASETDVKRFQTEAESAANLQHPHIVSVFEVGRHEGQSYFSMEYIEGQNLSQIVRDQPLPPKRAAAYVRDVGEAIHYSHQQGTLHRDLKPSNVLIDQNDRVQITDFGLAMKVEGDSELTRTGQVLGTPSYMPPEQAQHKRGLIGPASDIYSIGAVLYELLTGRPPFQADSAVETLRQVVETEPLSPRELNPAVPKDLETVCLKCLQKEQYKRYRTAQHLADDLGRILRGEPILARPIGRVERVWRWAKRRPAVAGLSSLLVLSLVVGAVVSSMFAFQSVQNAKFYQNEFRRAEGLLDEKSLLLDQKTILTDDLERALSEREQALFENAESIGKLGASLEKERRLSYCYQFLLAYREYNNNRLTSAETILDLCRPEHRRWEWFYLKSRCNPLPATTLKFTAGGGGTAALSADRKRALLIDRDGDSRRAQISLIDIATGSVVNTFVEERPRLVAMSQNERFYATTNPKGAGNSMIHVWERGSRTTAFQWSGQVSVKQVSLSPDGEQLAAVVMPMESIGNGSVFRGRQSILKVWNVRTNKLEFTLEEPDYESFYDAVYAPNGAWLAAVSGRDVILFDLTGQEIVRMEPSPQKLSAPLVLSDDGKLIAVPGLSETIMVWSTDTGAFRKQLDIDSAAFSSSIRSLDFSPDEQQLVCAAGGSDGDSTVQAFDLESGSEVFSLRLKEKVDAIAFDAYGRLISFTNGIGFRNGVREEGFVRLWEMHDHSVTDLVAPEERPRQDRFYGMSFSPDDSLVAIGGDWQVIVWNAATRELLHKFGTPRPRTRFYGVDFTPDSRFVAAACRDGSVRIWELTTGDEYSKLTFEDTPIFSVHFESTGERIAASCRDGRIIVWNWRDEKQLCTLVPDKKSRATRVMFHPNGKQLAVGCSDKLHIWDLETEQKVMTLHHGHEVWSTAYSHDGSIIASGGGELVKLWDAASGQELNTMRCYHGKVIDVSFSPDDQRLVSSDGRNSEIKIWDVPTGFELLTLKHDRPTSVRFSNSGHRLAAMGDDRLKIWESRPSEEKPLASQQLKQADTR